MQRHITLFFLILMTLLFTLQCEDTSSDPDADADDDNPPAGPLAYIYVNPSAVNLLVGDTLRFHASGSDQNGYEIEDLAFHWAVADTSLATIDQQGLLTAIAAGNTNLIVSSDTVSATHVTVHIEEFLEWLRLQQENITVNCFNTANLSFRARDSYGSYYYDYDDLPVTWHSSDTTVATIDTLGVVYGRSAGTSILTCSYASYESENQCTVTVLMTWPEVRSDSATAITETSATLNGYVIHDGGGTLNEVGICWSTHSYPSNADSCLRVTPDTSAFSATLDNLVSNSPYYYRAYVINDVGIAYGDIISFTTLAPDSARDIDGNAYEVVRIGDQYWMAANLKTTRYLTGETINNPTDAGEWSATTEGAYADYNNDDYNTRLGYGRLYNWYAIDDDRGLAPEGWRVATDEDWMVLEEYLGMSPSSAQGLDWRGDQEGGKLKYTGYNRWYYPNTGATDEYGFEASPAGRRNPDGSFEGQIYEANYWTQSGYTSTTAFYRSLSNSSAQIYRYIKDRHAGFSVRCVKDAE